MESIVKMGVSGKNTYGKNEQRDGYAGTDPYGRYDAYGEMYGEMYPQNEPAAPAYPVDAVPAAKPSVKDDEEQQRLEKEKAEKERLAERKRQAEEERVLMRKRRRHYRLIMIYVIMTVVISYVLLRMAGNLNTVFGVIGKWVAMIGGLLQPLFWGFVLAYILSPLADRFEKSLRRIKFFSKKGKSRRGPAVAITCVLALLVIVLLLSVVVSAITRSLRVASLDDLVIMVQSLAGTLGNFQQSVTNSLAHLNISSEEINSALSQIGQAIGNFTKSLSLSLTGTIGHISGFFTSTLFAIIFCIYFMLDGKRLARYWNRVLLALFGRETRKDFHVLLGDADAVFSGYIRGQLIDALIMAVLVSAALWLIGVKYAVIIGVLSGIGNLIPYLGPVVAYGSTILVCLLSGDLRRLLVALVILFVIQTVDGNVINPRLLSSSIDIHPMLVIAALIIGGAVGGIVGMLFAVPVAAFLKIQFEKIIDRLLQARKPAKKGKRKRKRTGTAAAKKRSAAETVRE